MENEPKWSASISVFPQHEVPGYAVFCFVSGASSQDALDGARIVSDLVTRGRRHAVRAEPEADSQLNIETDSVEHRGYARFVVWDEPGGRVNVVNGDAIPKLGKAL